MTINDLWNEATDFGPLQLLVQTEHTEHISTKTLLLASKTPLSSMTCLCPKVMHGLYKTSTIK